VVVVAVEGLFVESSDGVVEAVGWHTHRANTCEGSPCDLHERHLMMVFPGFEPVLKRRHHPSGSDELLL
jgi:hypothetical protein